MNYLSLVVAFGLMVFVSFPFAVLAQSSGGVIAAPTTSAGWISLVIQTLAVPLIGLVSQALWGFIERRKGHDAIGKILELIDAVGQPIWDRMADQTRLVLADGIVTPEERESLRRSIEAEMQLVIQPATLKLAMKALGLPNLGGLASWLLAKLLARWKGAHDTQDKSVPNAVTGVYPATVPSGTIDAPAPDFGG